ncbi:MAG TPA: hypothetical protein VHB20_03755 [Verrucomicrobiae bacterium]|jgi:hypothetical protein|nr:hypothetical protein [Verrucomicrobiae bacterium]
MKPVDPVGESSDEAPGVPGFRSWRGVYIFLLAALAFYIVALALGSRWEQ